MSASETARALEAEDGPESARDDVWETLAQFVQIGAWKVRGALPAPIHSRS